MGTYSIRDLEHLSGIKAHTLRIWEQRYNIIRPKRTDTNIRYYDAEDLKLVLNISVLNGHGYKISKIAQMSPEAMQQEVLQLARQATGYIDQVQSLTISMIDLDEDRFERIMSTNILQFGFEKTMLNVVYPFLHKIGVLWQTGAINPAHEHFITNLIRQKLIVAIDAQVVPRQGPVKTFVLFLPEGELHELSLLFANYLIRSRHHRVVYLGQSLPFDDLVGACRMHEPDFLFSIITTLPDADGIQRYVTRLGEAFPQTKVLLTGYQVLAQPLDLPANVQLLSQIDELIRMLENKPL
ncbi:DNA-binding transcriptional regulator, MerR family [Catalinimonas alkaloidigena]|uniref:DNA-binding transcriptional regulator, MerR family n=1 Tax=Catalinimonas alkaloidigena TaxID=1075417 RepID=A0A1G9DMW4_9BACT|nr:MerR family transcriptional regulator [Catalinimonas alkaloidigena]SDK65115.1 DNA-binding transcriptional regulator, MerR family [Catalinimonas alkaloidigena]